MNNSRLRPVNGRKLRRDFAITAYVGANGGGKTCSMIWDSLPSLLAGRPVLSTVRILDFENPRPCDGEGCDITMPPQNLRGLLDLGDDAGAAPVWDHSGHMARHPGYIPFTSWHQLHMAEHCDVLMDEVTGVASSRESHAMPGEIGNRLNQLRRADVVLRWTAPSWKRADTIIRECTQAVVSCRGFMAKKYENQPGEPERVWKQRRLFVWRTFDAYAFEDFTVGTRERLKPLGTDAHWGPGSPAFAAYDTYDQVLSIGAVSAAGRCMTCGGRRRVESCSCDQPHDDGGTSGRRPRPARVPLAGAPVEVLPGRPVSSAAAGSRVGSGGNP